MINTKSCEWLLQNADAPVRYRVARELLKDDSLANKIENELLDHPTVKLWLRNLKPNDPPQHWSMVHGSFDFCLENAMNKAVQLGLHAELPPVAEAVRFYIDIMNKNPAQSPYRRSDNQLGQTMIGNMLTLAGFKERAIVDCISGSLDELYGFASKGDYDIYLSDDERNGLKGVPAIWKGRKFIREHLFADGPVYPLIYDIIALHKLYADKNPDTDEKINAVIGYISTDEFHERIEDGYGIVICNNGTKYYGMGWDPKYPGWFDVKSYMENVSPQKLLFFAQYISNYPAAQKTRWFAELLDYLDTYKTENNTYLFPASWLKETKGYAVQGHHLSFGENRRNKNWAETESTFYMQILRHKA